MYAPVTSDRDLPLQLPQSPSQAGVWLMTPHSVVLMTHSQPWELSFPIREQIKGVWWQADCTTCAPFSPGIDFWDNHCWRELLSHTWVTDQGSWPASGRSPSPPPSTDTPTPGLTQWLGGASSAEMEIWAFSSCPRDSGTVIWSWRCRAASGCPRGQEDRHDYKKTV